MKRQLELSLIPTLPLDLMHEIYREILDYKTLMCWHGCCRSYWLSHVAVDRAQWLKELEEKRDLLKEMSIGCPSVEPYRDYVTMCYAIQATKLCTAIEKVLPDIPSILFKADQRILPYYAYSLQNDLDLKDYVFLKKRFDFDDIIVLTQVYIFILQRYGWILYVCDDKKIYRFPIKYNTLVSNDEKLYLRLDVNRVK